MPDFQGYLFNDTGTATNAASVAIFTRATAADENTSSSLATATTTTNAAGLWTINGVAEGTYDVRITSSGSVRWRRYQESVQYTTLETANFRIRNPAGTFVYDFVPGAITANRTVNLPVATGTVTLPFLEQAQTWTAVQTYGAGGLLRWSAGTVVTAAQYEIERDTDATNQLHFNVPTGASMEWSVNDAARMTMTNTRLSPVNIGIYLSGLTAGAISLITGGVEIDSAVNLNNPRIYFTGVPSGGGIVIATDANAYVHIGGTPVNRATTIGSNQLQIQDGTAPVGTLANAISLYSTAGELRVMDSVGNATLLSPHGFKFFPRPDQLAWSYLSQSPDGDEVNVDMWGAIRAVEQLTRKQFIYTKRGGKMDVFTVPV